MAKPRNENIYALYKGDTFICDGTLREIAEFTGLSLNRIFKFKTPGYVEWLETRKENENSKKNAKPYELILIDDGEDDLD